MRYLNLIAISLLAAAASIAQEMQDTTGINYRYKQKYDFVTMPDTIFTFQSEFKLPEGFQHADSLWLTDFQNYVSNFPLWHKGMKVGSFRAKIIFKNKEISRPVHLPYNGPAYTDKAMPIRILAEFLHDRSREKELSIIPRAGEIMIYDKWLASDITYGPGKSVQFNVPREKEDNLSEYYTFMRFCLENTTYESLARNCDTIPASDARPGDIFVAHDENGKDGVVYVILHMIVNASDDKLYAVATGCKEACDFHIPLFNNDRNNPWIRPREIAELGGDYARRAFLRLKIH